MSTSVCTTHLYVVRPYALPGTARHCQESLLPVWGCRCHEGPISSQSCCSRRWSALSGVMLSPMAAAACCCGVDEACCVRRTAAWCNGGCLPLWSLTDSPAHRAFAFATLHCQEALSVCGAAFSAHQIKATVLSAAPASYGVVMSVRAAAAAVCVGACFIR